MEICSTFARQLLAACKRVLYPAPSRAVPLACRSCHQTIVLLLCLTGCLFVSTGARASHNTALPEDLTDMSLEALMNIEITSVRKRPQKKSEAAAAVFVIKQADLHRWGVTNIPDALRRVPGLQVARIDANKWAITARGFNSRFANKLLVLIDGRSVYTPLFTGVYWDANEVMLEDVERIEVIRGPGGSLWGANAVNGVINIITRSAADTQGTLVAAGAGNEEDGFVSLRHGATTADGRNYRVYGKFHTVDTGAPIDIGLPQTAAHDDSEFAQTGFRMDWVNANGDSQTLQGDVYDGHSDQQLLIATAPAALTDNATYNGGNLLYRWSQTRNPNSDYSLQAYYDYVHLDSATLYENRHTLDIDFQHHFLAREHHELMWGLNYRFIHDNAETTRIFSLSPSRRDSSLLSAFVQDEIRLFQDRGRLTLGSKFEHNDFSGFEIQPNARFSWLTDAGHTLWGAVSRAVRTPARGEHDVSLTVLPPPNPPGLPPLTVLGSEAFDSENLIAWELGYRFPFADRVSVDLAAFYNRYDRLRTVDIISMPPSAFEAVFGNDLEGNTQGIEIDVHWQVRPGLDLHANYTRLEVDLDLINGSMDTQSLGAEDASPTHQANLWLAADLGHNLQVDAGLRYVGKLDLDLSAAGLPAIGQYLALDARIGWSPRPGMELSLAGQNLLDSRHPEFNPDFIFSVPTEVERSIYGKVTWNF
ncbi:MAG: TonB-dependent receptor [Gammaproteobacteria bacterium]